MDAISFTGLYTRLKDKDLSLEQKLQLLRFAWKSAEVDIPNKEQVLIDLLTGYLLNKKKYQLVEEDIGRIWRCLYDVLRTKKAHLANKQGQGLVVKQSICQVILEALTHAISPEVRFSYLGSLIGCCQMLITSPTLSYIFTGRLDQMLSLLGTLCSLLVKYADEDSIRDSLLELVNETTKNYLRAQKTAPNQKQILHWGCTRLLPSFLSLWSVSRISPSLTGSVEKLCDVVEQTLFHKDHHEMYASHLNMKYGDVDTTATKKPIKQIEQLFTSLETHLRNKTTAIDAVSLYIPVLFESFIKADCHNSKLPVAHHMLKECCNLIGVQSDSAALCGPVSQAVVIKGLNKLLKTVQSLEVYSESTDEKGKQLPFYRHLVAVLLENNCISSDWYSCLTVLLQLNHHILEPSLSEILLNSWLNLESKNKEVMVDPLDEFLQELVSTYQKLRQFQKLMVRILDTLKRCSNTEFIVTPAGFLKRFGEVVQSLPQGMTGDIWKMFVQHLKDNHVDGEGTGHFQGVCALLCEYLLNVRVADYSTTDITTSAVQDLMVSMETEILAPLLQRSKKDESQRVMLVSTLHLCHIWGEMMIMLAQYTRYRADSFTANPQSHTATDLSYVHSYLGAKNWLKIHKRIRKPEDKMLLYLWDMLEVQQIRAQLLFTSKSAVTMAALFDLPSEVSQEDLTASWYPSVYNIDESNFLVAKWHLLVTNMSSVYKILTGEQCASIATFIVETAGGMMDNNRGEVSLSTVTRSLLNSSWVSEFSTLQPRIVTSVWRHLGRCFISKVKSGKKRKSSSLSADLQSVLNSLGDADTPWQDGLTSETADQLQKVTSGVNRLLDNQEHHGDVPDVDKILNYLQVLQRLPIEQMSSCDQLRCLFGLLSLTAYLTSCCQDEKMRTSPERQSHSEADVYQHEADYQNEAVLTSCLQLMMVVLEVSGTSSVYQLLEIHSSVEWLHRLSGLALHCKNKTFSLRLLLFIEMSCSSMVKDYQVLEKLSPVMLELSSSLKTSTESTLFIISSFLQDLSMLLGRPNLKASVRSVCSEMFVSMATEVLAHVKAIPSHKPVSHRIVKCIDVIIETKIAVEVKGHLMSSFLERLDGILDWCLKSLQKKTEHERKLTALNFLLVVSKHHKDYEGRLSSSKKLDIWNKLVNLLQESLQQQSYLPHVREDHNFGSGSLSYGQETDECGTRKMDGSEKKANLNRKHMKDNDMVDRMIKILDVKETVISDISVPLRTKYIKLPMQNSGSDAPHLNSETIISSAAINSMYRTLVYEGKWESQSSRVILAQVQSVIAANVMTFDHEDFTKVIQGIVEDVCTTALYSDVQKLQCSLYVWQRLLKLALSQKQAQVIVDAAQNLVLNFQSIIQQLSHSEDEKLLMSVAVPVMRAQEQMLKLGQAFLSPQTSVMCLHSCQFLPLGGSTYFPAFSAACSVLELLLLNHTETVLKSIPSYLGCAKRLLLSVVQYSSQETVQGDTRVTENLISCAHQMERLFTQISTHKVDFSKVALYVVSDYVTAMQKVTLVPSIKRALVPAIYKMLDLCDKHSIAQLHTVLSHGVCEVFKLLYADYNKYYKYTGKI